MAGPDERQQTQPVAPVRTKTYAAGRFVVQRLLGEGGQKTVYLARDTELERDVAIADLAVGGLDEASIARVRREGQTLAGMGAHPHIVTIFDIGLEDDRPYIVCEYMRGGDLERTLRDATGPLPLDRVLAIAQDLARALAAAHEHGIIHRDLKPANVWLTEGGRAKLGDFGLAIAGDQSRMTQAGTVLGTAAYMSPEQATGAEVTAQSDLYALGCVIYEMLTGERPFQGESALAVLSQHVSEAPLAPSARTANVPTALEVHVLQLMAKRPAERPATAEDVLARLEEIAAGGASPAAEPVDPLARIRTLPFIGRNAEYETLLRKLSDAQGGRGSVVLLAGAPGIGKTRLAAEFCEQASSSASVIRGNCYEGNIAAPFGPWLEALRSLVEQTPDERLSETLGPGAPEVATLLPDIKRRLPGLGEAAKLDPESERARLFESIAAFLRNAAAQRPLVVYLDDLHWCDRPSLALLEQIAQGNAEQRIVIVGTYRDIEVDRTHPLGKALAALRRMEHHERLAIRGMPRGEVDDLLATIEPSEESRAVRRVLSAVLFRQTEGNPLFIREVIRHLIEAGKVVYEDGRWTSHVTNVADLGIPEGIKEAIGRRLSGLSEACSRMLGRACALTGAFSWDELQAICNDSEDELLDALEEALAAQLLEERGKLSYGFTHGLIRATLYDELSSPRRVRLHRQIAEALEVLHADSIDDHLGELAAHYMASTGHTEHKAIEYSIRAARKAAEMVAWEDAAQHYQRALEALPAEGDADRRCRLLTDLGAVLVFCGQSSEAVDAYRQAADLARMTGLPELLGAVACGLEEAGYFVQGDPVLPKERLALIDEALAVVGTEDSLLRARLLAHRSRAAQAVAGGENAIQLGGVAALLGSKDPVVLGQAKEAVAIAERLGDPEVLAETLDYLAQYMLGPAEEDEQRDICEKLIQVAREGNRGQYELAGLIWLFNLMMQQGDIARARELHAELTRRSSELRVGWATWSSLAVEAALAMCEGKFDHADRQVYQALSFGQSINHPSALLVFGAQLFVLRWCQGRLAELEEMWQGVVDGSPGVGVYQAGLALLYAETGKMDEAATVLDAMREAGFAALPEDTTWVVTVVSSCDATARLHDRLAAAELYELLAARYPDGCASVGVALSLGSVARSLGQMAAVLERWDDADGHFIDALALNEGMDHRPALAWTRLSYGDMLLRRGRPEDRDRAVALLNDALSYAREAGMAKVQSDAEALLGEMAQRD